MVLALFIFQNCFPMLVVITKNKIKVNSALRSSIIPVPIVKTAITIYVGGNRKIDNFTITKMYF